MVLIIIKGVFRRYESWNPIHPTTRAFWGYGLGIRCGVGWGPVFGPEVIGYVGADCGIRFSVGITLAGIGISFPANFLLESPYKGTFGFIDLQSNTLPAMRNMIMDCWNQIVDGEK
ncbi:hypothetical protein MKW94_030879 [Papaver nudicaule]|uniref:Uncharacterized protein n=1 Tax=Papaver nudicaule TaxID=74823 RepID=A0AA41VJX4_PAPNU|nr:hypothetical protein [Papaver nudicaule]